MERLLTTDELAEYLRVDVVTIRRLVNRGELPAYRIGSEYRFSSSDVENYLQRQRVTAGATEATDPSSGASKERMQKMRGSRDRFDKFNDEARQVLNFAQEEAQSFKHSYIGTEHLLLGLLREEEGLAVQVLRNLSIELKRVREAVEFIIGHGKHVGSGDIGLTPRETGLTPRAKKVIELAVDEARRLDHHYIGTEHILVGLIREGEGIAAGVLESLGVNLELARAEVLRAIDQPQENQTGAVPPIPPEATSLLAEGDAELICTRCGVHCPAYFRHCFNCGQQLKPQ
jgi:excisionase family DNA binding protein